MTEIDCLVVGVGEDAEARINESTVQVRNGRKRQSSQLVEGGRKENVTRAGYIQRRLMEDNSEITGGASTALDDAPPHLSPTFPAYDLSAFTRPLAHLTTIHTPFAAPA